MSRALRLHAVTLPVPDLPAAERFYRWVLAMKASAEEPVEGQANLGWGKEDRLRLVDAAADPNAREAIELRMEARESADVAAWLAERDLGPIRVLAHADDADEIRDLWPDVELVMERDPATSNRFVLSLAAPADVRVDLHVPLPTATVVRRGRHGPFYRRSKEWQGLENPGLLGVTLGASDPPVLIEFLRSLGIEAMADPDPDAPLLAGDHQIRLEQRDPPGIYGTAFVVAAARLPDLVRTLERFEVPHRHDRNHLLAVDPAGRILAVNGVRAG